MSDDDFRFSFRPSGGEFEPFESAPQLAPAVVPVTQASQPASSDLLSNIDLLGGLDAPVPLAPSFGLANQTLVFPGASTTTLVPNSLQMPAPSGGLSSFDIFDSLPASSASMAFHGSAETSNGGVPSLLPFQPSVSLQNIPTVTTTSATLAAESVNSVFIFWIVRFVVLKLNFRIKAQDVYLAN